MPSHDFLNEEKAFLDYVSQAIGLSDWLPEANNLKPMAARSQ
jgi:hypothetical protein